MKKFIGLFILVTLLFAGCSPFSWRSSGLPTKPLAQCAAPPIPLEAGYTRQAEGCLPMRVEGGQTWREDSLAVVKAAGYQGELNCQNSFVTLSWGLTEGEGDMAVWTVTREEDTLPLGGGASGQIRTGCGVYELHNKDVLEPLRVDLRVVVDLPAQ
ncbi:MAG: hypothetical protein QJR00_01570 [Bacillota bacterium]|nr:hypothetical protein [Bacillota bacterium]